MSRDELMKRLSYDPETGIFIRKYSDTRIATIRFVGKQAGSITRLGYRIIRVGRKDYLAHRLAWLFMTGSWPADLIDHVDMKPANNVFSNLRPANKSLNGANRFKQANNTSGYKGVVRARRSSKWKAQIQVNGRNTYLGTFATQELAIKAYAKAALEKFGEYAKVNA